MSVFDPYTEPGFDTMGHETPTVDLEALHALGQANRGKYALEVGSWAGTTARVLAQNYSMVYCVDHWKGTRDPEDPMNRTNKRFDPQEAYETFCRNMRWRLISCVVPLVGPSSFWASLWYGPRLSLVFIDGDHRYEHVANDIRLWRKHIKDGGVICGHDYGVFEGVTRAVDELIPDRKRAGYCVWYAEVHHE